MAIRISGVTLPDDKNVSVALTAIFGIGPSLSARILQTAKVIEGKKVKDLTRSEEQAIRDYIETSCTVEGELRREIMMNIKHHKDIGTYRGLRHLKHLPVRGQRTRTNSRTVRGNVRRTAGSGRRSAAEKT